MRRDEAVLIPKKTDFSSIGGLSSESKDILCRFRPETIGHANRLPGLTPAAVVAVLHYIRGIKNKIISKTIIFSQKGNIVTADEVGELLERFT